MGCVGTNRIYLIQKKKTGKDKWEDKALAVRERPVCVKELLLQVNQLNGASSIKHDMFGQVQ